MRSDPARDEELLETVAAIDCGTNSTRLLIIDDQMRPLEREMRITRLGEGVDATKSLSLEAIDRTVKVLADYRRLMDLHRVTRVRVAATSAVRDATNGEAFLAFATDVLGIRPEVLNGSEEGRTSFAGATSDLPPGGDGLELVVDIGGGSTELAVGNPYRTPDISKRNDVVAISLDVGCVRISERFFHDDPPTKTQIAGARAEIERLLEAAREKLPVLDPGGRVIGLAGSVSTLASLDLRLSNYDRQKVHHYILSRSDVRTWLDLLASEDSSAHLARPGMVSGREDVIVGGVLVLDAVMDVFDRHECLVSESDILDGLAYGLLGRER